MHDLLKSTSPGMRFLTAIFNLIMANLFFMVTCIPIITIGPALTSLYKITFEILDGEEVFLLSDYFGTFFKTFKRSFITWVPMLLLSLIMSYSVFLVWAGLEGTSFWMMIPPLLVLFILFSVGAYAFPLLSQCYDPLKVILKDSLLLAVAHLPTTIFIFIVHAGLAGMLIAFDAVSVTLLSIMVFMGFALTALLCSVFLRKIFLPYLPKEEDEEE
ncbi:MAG: YesL family protein [Saccharofermentans sp.]|nr:YesL family protein [Saccharofermentans sp.]